MKRNWVIILFLLIFLQGCSSGVLLDSDQLKALGLPETAKVIVDGFDARQIALYRMHTKVAESYFSAVSRSGVIIEPKIEKVGDTVFVTQVVTYIPKPELISLPTKLDVHPIWQTVEKIAQYSLFGYGIHEIAGMFEAASDSAGTYTFNDSDVYGSFNKSGGNLDSSWLSTTETTSTLTSTITTTP